MTDTPMTPDQPTPVELTERQLDALSAAGNRALNDHYHEDLCFCRSWPTSCVSSGGYFMGTWDTSAFDIGLPAVLGVWESLRNDRHAAKIAELRADNEQLRTRVAELEALKPARFQDCQVCGAGYEYGQSCSVCEFKKQMAAAQAGVRDALPRDLSPEQARWIEHQHPETSTAHDCTLPLVRRLDCGHRPHEVCQDCDRCPHTCRCASPEATL
ncbi:hypothetical protein G3I39_25045 [Streptomyces fulvissimus]|uniref:Uncharacterized protein n=1 Tax=Streptomyces microflavus TaxID=1919 RepID=A0A6N9VC24_STRMI|nr:hypothetical protein [Streptomyces microflavus]NEB70296.1 hypothetical protein [Streptomyces microflavus]NEE45575.1 hypothetical protein [Streptomyces sp. SID8455]